MALDFDIRDPKNQKLIMTFLIPIVILAAVFQFVVSPLKEEVAAKNVELTNAQQQIDIIRRSLKTPELLREEKEQLELKLAELQGLLPDTENVAVLLSQFSMVERDANVYLVGFDIIDSVEGGDKPWKANRYRMTIEAGYHQFAGFIGQIMALPRILSLSNLRITTNPMINEYNETYEGMENQPRKLTIEGTLTASPFQPSAQEPNTANVHR